MKSIVLENHSTHFISKNVFRSRTRATSRSDIQTTTTSFHWCCSVHVENEWSLAILKLDLVYLRWKLKVDEDLGTRKDEGRLKRGITTHCFLPKWYCKVDIFTTTILEIQFHNKVDKLSKITDVDVNLEKAIQILTQPLEVSLTWSAEIVALVRWKLNVKDLLLSRIPLLSSLELISLQGFCMKFHGDSWLMIVRLSQHSKGFSWKGGSISA